MSITIQLPLPRIRIFSIRFLRSIRSQATQEEIEQGCAELLESAAGKNIVKLPPAENAECNYLLGGAIRCIQYYDAIHDELNTRLDIGFVEGGNA